MAGNKANSIPFKLYDILTKGGYSGTAATLKSDIDSKVQSVTGTTVDNTDPLNPIVNLQTAIQTAVADIGGNYTGTNVEAILAEIATSLTGIAHTSITGIDLKPTGTPNEYTVEITWVDENSTTQVTTDASPITIDTGVQTVTGTAVDNTDPINPVINITPKQIVEIHGGGNRPLNNNTYSLNALTTVASNIGGVFTIAGGIITYTGPATTGVKIMFRASASQLTNGTRSTSKHAIFKNNAVESRTETYAYHRVINDGHDSATYTGTFSLNTGDTIELRSAELTSTDVVTQLMDQTNLIIEI